METSHFNMLLQQKEYERHLERLRKMKSTLNTQPKPPAATPRRRSQKISRSHSGDIAMGYSSDPETEEAKRAQTAAAQRRKSSVTMAFNQYLQQKEYERHLERLAKMKPTLNVQSKSDGESGSDSGEDSSSTDNSEPKAPIQKKRRSKSSKPRKKNTMDVSHFNQIIQQKEYERHLKRVANMKSTFSTHLEFQSTPRTRARGMSTVETKSTGDGKEAAAASGPNAPAGTTLPAIQRKNSVGMDVSSFNHFLQQREYERHQERLKNMKATIDTQPPPAPAGRPRSANGRCESRTSSGEGRSGTPAQGRKQNSGDVSSFNQFLMEKEYERHLHRLQNMKPTFDSHMPEAVLSPRGRSRSVCAAIAQAEMDEATRSSSPQHQRKNSGDVSSFNQFLMEKEYERHLNRLQNMKPTFDSHMPEAVLSPRGRSRSVCAAIAQADMDEAAAGRDSPSSGHQRKNSGDVSSFNQFLMEKEYERHLNRLQNMKPTFDSHMPEAVLSPRGRSRSVCAAIAQAEMDEAAGGSSSSPRMQRKNSGDVSSFNQFLMEKEYERHLDRLKNMKPTLDSHMPEAVLSPRGRSRSVCSITAQGDMDEAARSQSPAMAMRRKNSVDVSSFNQFLMEKEYERHLNRLQTMKPTFDSHMPEAVLSPRGRSRSVCGGTAQAEAEAAAAAASLGNSPSPPKIVRQGSGDVSSFNQFLMDKEYERHLSRLQNMKPTFDSHMPEAVLSPRGRSRSVCAMTASPSGEEGPLVPRPPGSPSRKNSVAMDASSFNQFLQQQEYERHQQRLKNMKASMDTHLEEQSTPRTRARSIFVQKAIELELGEAGGPPSPQRKRSVDMTNQPTPPSPQPPSTPRASSLGSPRVLTVHRRVFSEQSNGPAAHMGDYAPHPPKSPRPPVMSRTENGGSSRPESSLSVSSDGSQRNSQSRSVHFCFDGSAADSDDESDGAKKEKKATDSIPEESSAPSTPVADSAPATPVQAKAQEALAPGEAVAPKTEEPSADKEKTSEEAASKPHGPESVGIAETPRDLSAATVAV